MPDSVIFSPGLDPDAWRILLAARQIAEHHTYVASRLPGYPVPELVYSLFASSPIWLSIGLTFLVSVGGFLSYHKILGVIGIKERLLLTSAFACTPVVLINSFTTMDYMWAISFALFSFLLATKKQSFFSGLFLGVAIGCRITTVLMVIPLSLFIWSSSDEKRIKVKECALFLSSTVMMSLLCFGPVISSYGMSFLTHSQGSPIQIVALAKLATIDTLGLVGVIALALAMAMQIVKRNQPHDHLSPILQQWKNISWMIVGIFGFLFALMPLEAGYLIPLIPFLWLLARMYLSHESFRILAVGMILSSLFLSLDSKDRPWSAPSSALSVHMNIAGRSIVLDGLKGPLFLDFAKRKSQLAYANAILDWARSHPDSTVLVTGVWMPPLTYLTNKTISRDTEERFQTGKVTMVGLLDRDAADMYQRTGVHIFYIRGQDRYDEEVYRIGIQLFGGKELEIDNLIP